MPHEEPRRGQEPEETAPDEEQEEPRPSVQGRGWDVLAGGEQNARARGGDDPFDEDDEEVADWSVDDASRRRAEPGEVNPPRDLSPEELDLLGTPPADKTALHPDVSDEPELPQTLAGESFPEGDYQSMEGPPADAVPRETPTAADKTALPEEPVEEGELPQTLSGEPFPETEPEEDEPPPPQAQAPPLPEPEEEAEPSAGAGTSEEERDTPPGEPPFDETGRAPFGMRSEKTPFGAPPVTGERPGEPIPPVMPVGAAMPGEPPLMAAQGISAAAQPHDPFVADMDQAAQVSGPDELSPATHLEAILITQERIDALWDEINETYNIVIMDVRGYYTTTDLAISDLKRARELLLAGEEHFDNAEELVKRVKARMRLEEKVRQWSRTRGTWLAIYLIIWLMVLGVGTLLTNRFLEIADAFVPGWMAATFLPALYGGLGGVVGALWVLIKHIVKVRDFDPIHTPWYILNPFMGMALGAITYFLLRSSTLILGTNPVSLGDPGEQFGLYFLSVVVGFNQNVLWALIDRVIKAIIPPEGETAATTERAAAAEPSQD